ncbi:serine carboxypeptidase-like 11, partial [Cynara cardunculus var. scolymus]|uniref:serine carboxypeptidase-like 11 n=1 Tax=Cynara cardunculus var. scolymus TaxID=59895 RepID=UPI000D626E82
MDQLFLVIVVILYFRVAISTLAGRVEYLPGFQGPLPFHLETGYIGVDENEDVQLFYYFIQSESNPRDDPLMLWISGGPGCSSITGLLYSIGPIKFVEVNYNESLPTLILRPNSWTKMASIIFLDIPVGTGFSYATTTRATHSNDLQLAKHAYEFMRKWLKSHPGFVSNPFYIGGDSYSGIPIPAIAQLISNGNDVGNEPRINMKGYVLGNPRTFPNENNFDIRFANGMGLISDELYKSLLDSCHGEYRSEYISVNNVACRKNLESYEQCIDGIEKPHILEPNCSASTLPIKLPSEMQFEEQQPFSGFYCQEDLNILMEYWANDANVREALHVQKGSIGHWVRCSSDLRFTKILEDVRPYHQNLSKKGFRALVYSGDHDMVIPYQSTHAWIKDLNYTVTDRWRSWKLRGQIAGYTESYSNMMTYATVKGGGHVAPESKPEESFAMFK